MPSPMPKVKIHLTAGKGGTVEVDGVPVKGVAKIAIEATRDKAGVTLFLAHPEIELTAESAEVIARYLEAKPE